MKNLLLITAIVLTGCAAPMGVTMMSRDSGATYKGTFDGTSNGAGTLSVIMGETTCSGPAARVSSKETTAVGSAYATGSNGNLVNALATTSTSGDSNIKAILSCSNGKGMRCDLTGRNRSGGGTCTDDAGKIFDVVVTSK